VQGERSKVKAQSSKVIAQRSKVIAQRSKVKAQSSKVKNEKAKLNQNLKYITTCKIKYQSPFTPCHSSRAKPMTIPNRSLTESTESQRMSFLFVGERPTNKKVSALLKFLSA
jgi:hypothetical protein